jgi:hypothetical protein
MRIEWLLGIGGLALMMATHARGQEREIAVGLKDTQVVPFRILAQAQETAARVYAGVDVKLRWRSQAATEIWMQFDTDVAPEVHPGAMGYAMPYGKTGTRIHILVDRVLRAGSQGSAGVLLGHVMAHELGHVLEGISRHSESGLMKARWDDHDLDEMLTGPLSISADDADLIKIGVVRIALPHPNRGEASKQK